MSEDRAIIASLDHLIEDAPGFPPPKARLEAKPGLDSG